MDHQVEHDVDVEAALGERSEAMDFDEPRIGQHRAGGRHRRVESLDVPDGQHRVTFHRGVNDRVGFSEGSRERLLDQHRDARLEKRQRDRVMNLGRHGHRHRIDPADHVPIIVHGLRAARCRDRIGAGPVGIDDGRQRGIRQRRQDAGMMPPEVADADYGKAQRHKVPSESGNRVIW